MKVFMINTVCGVKSTGRICTDLAQILDSRGHQCLIAYGRERAPEKLEKYAFFFGNKLSLKKDAVFTKLFDNAGFNSAVATDRLIRKIKEFNPDIIHLHNLHGCYIHVGRLFRFLEKYGKPVVWTLHDCWPFTGHCAYFTAAGCRKWLEGCHHCIQHKSYPAALLADRSKTNYRKKKALFTKPENMTIVTPSEWLAELVKRSFLKDQPVKVIHNGIDLSVFKPEYGNIREKYGLEGKKILLGVASAWDKRKGLTDFLKLSKMLDDSYAIMIVGLSEKQIDELPGKIVGIARTNSIEELAQIYTAADVFLNLTYEDNYPTVNLEAQACGTPVITYRTGGSVESVPEENVVEQGDLQGLVKILARASHPLSEQSFDKAALFGQYLELYEQLL